VVHIYYLLALALLWDDNAGGSLNPPKQSWQKASTQAANSAHIQMQCMLGAAAFAHNIIGLLKAGFKARTSSTSSKQVSMCSGEARNEMTLVHSALPRTK